MSKRSPSPSSQGSSTPLRPQPTRRHAWVRRIGARFVAVASIVLIALGCASAAHAATTVPLPVEATTEPTDGSELQDPPTAFVLTFNQKIPLEVSDTLSATCGQQLVVKDNGIYENDRQKLTYKITSPIDSGICVVTWRLEKSDGSVYAEGNFTFSVNAALPVTTTTAAAVEGEATTTTSALVVQQTDTSQSIPPTEPDRTFGVGVWLGRLVSNLGILVLFGSLVVIGTGWPEGPEYYITSQFLRLVWIVSLLGTLLYVIAFAAATRGGSLSTGISPAAWFELASNGWPGIGAVLRLILVAASGYVALAPERIDDPNTGIWAWMIPGTAVVTLALSRVTGPLLPVGVIVGILHAFGTAVWVGGAVFVGRIVLAGPGEEDLVVATRTYARTSVLAILVTVVTGVIQTIRLDGSDLFSTHGLIVLAKVALVMVMLFIGLEARKQVRFRLDREYEMSPGNAARFRRAYGTETIFGVLALALSSLLISFSPGTELPWAGETYTKQINFDDPTTGIRATVKIGPLTVGQNGYLLQLEEPANGVTELKLVFIPPEGSQSPPVWKVEDVVPLTGRGSAWRPQSVGIPLNIAGTWQLQLQATTSIGVQPGVSQTFQVTGPAGGPVASVPTATVSVPAPTNAPANVAVVDSTTNPASVATQPATTTTVAAG